MNLVTSPPPPRRDSFNPCEKTRSNSKRHVHGFGRRAVLENVRVSVRKNHDLAGFQGNTLAIFQTGKGATFG